MCLAELKMSCKKFYFFLWYLTKTPEKEVCQIFGYQTIRENPTLEKLLKVFPFKFFYQEYF